MKDDIPYTRIDSIDQLAEVCADKEQNCFILLAGGAARSSKTIYYDTAKKRFEVSNFIDGTEQFLSKTQLETQSNIAEAIEKKSFYLQRGACEQSGCTALQFASSAWCFKHGKERGNQE